MALLSNTGIRAGASGGSPEITYSDDVTASAGFNGANVATSMFDGSLSTKCEPSDDSTVTWDAENGSSGYLDVSSFEVYVAGAGSVQAGDFTVNGTDYGDSVGSAAWLSLSGVTRFNNATWYHRSGLSAVEVYAWKSDGVILTDP